MIGGVTRRGLPHLSGVPHHHVNKLNKSILRADCLCAAHISKTTQYNTTLHVQHTFFVHFFVFTARLQREIPSRFYGGRKMHHKDFFFLLLNLSSVSKKLFKSSLMCPFPRPNLYWPPIGQELI